MPFLYTSNTFIKVNRSGKNLYAECTLLNNDTEAVAWVETDVETLKIIRAGWSLYRSADMQPGFFELPELIGIEAYITGGAALKKRLGNPGQELPRELIAECFRGILQAETYFFTERGYTSGKDYDDFFEKNNTNACIYYSHLDQIDKQWTEWVESTERNFNLFNRNKTVILQNQDGKLTITASFIDSFHHLSVNIVTNPDGIVEKVNGNFLSAPDPICFTSNEHLLKLTGVKMPTLNKKQIAELAGGSEGCTHLVDLIYETAKVLSNIKKQ